MLKKRKQFKDCMSVCVGKEIPASQKIKTKSEKANRIRKEENQALANRVMNVKYLKNDDKCAIYQALTGKQPLKKKKGAPTNDFRNLLLAVDYIHGISEDKKKPTEFFKELTEEYNFSGGKDTQYATFHKALNKGLELLVEVLEHLLMYSDDDMQLRDMRADHEKQTESARLRLKHIKEYREKYAHL